MANDNSKATSITDDVTTKELAADIPIGDLEPVAYFNGAMPTGVTVSHEERRIFVNFPRWGDEVPFTVAEIIDYLSLRFGVIG